jgi:hypothetical protein
MGTKLDGTGRSLRKEFWIKAWDFGKPFLDY